MAGAAILPTIKAGATYRVGLTWTNPGGSVINLTGCSAHMQIRDANNNLLYDLGANNNITIVGASGQINIWLTPAQTAPLLFANAKYDLLVTLANGDVIELISGSISASALITS